MYYVYVLKSRTGEKYYTGCTDDLAKRLAEHNGGKSEWSKRHVPWEVHYSEEYANEVASFRREKYLKSHAGRKFLKKISEKTA